MVARVLVVDDAAFMRMRLSNLLRQAGHEVLEASNGFQALEVYGAEKPDLVFMDITMPEMDGIEALKRLRALDGEARVVMCTALGQQSMVIEAVKSGAKDFIVKPFQPDRVLQAVAKWVS